MADLILPSEATQRRWSPDHQRLHRHLLRRPDLLPEGAALLLAVSGGQDSMALTALLADLRRLHHWRLHLWHGDHGWRAESAIQCRELAVWAAGADLPLLSERADPAPASEAEARSWRYARLESSAAMLGCRHVVTGHTASDRAETMLLNLARGSHRLGLSSLRAQRALGRNDPALPERPQLVRPLLPFCREDTARICRALGVPVWEDASNDDRRFRRNRMRAEVLPVLEALHPGACRRMAAQAERLEEEQNSREDLLDLALESLRAPGDAQARRLARRRLGRLCAANRRQLLEHWLRRQGGPGLSGADLDRLSRRLVPEAGPGQQDLADGWQLVWDRSTLKLKNKQPGERNHGHG